MTSLENRHIRDATRCLGVLRPSFRCAKAQMLWRSHPTPCPFPEFQKDSETIAVSPEDNSCCYWWSSG